MIALSFPHSVDDQNPENKNKIDVRFGLGSMLNWKNNEIFPYRKSLRTWTNITGTTSRFTIYAVRDIFNFQNSFHLPNLISTLVKLFHLVEKQYNPIYFNNNVERFPIYDYDVPSLRFTFKEFIKIYIVC